MLGKDIMSNLHFGYDAIVMIPHCEMSNTKSKAGLLISFPF
jgi:hypothetical protein